MPSMPNALLVSLEAPNESECALVAPVTLSCSRLFTTENVAVAAGSARWPLPPAWSWPWIAWPKPCINWSSVVLVGSPTVK